MYAKIPDDIFSKNLSGYDWRVLCALIAHRGKNGDAWPSVSRVAEMTGIRECHVSITIGRLEKSGMIAREKVGTRNRYTFPCLDAQPEQPAETQEPAPAPVVANNATAAETAPAPVPAPAPEPVPVQESTPEPAPAPAQPTDDNPSRVAEPVPQPEPAPAPVQSPAPEQPRAQQPAQVPAPVVAPAPEPKPAPVVAPVAAQEQKPVPAPVATQKPAPMPALEPAPPAPKRAIVSARVARLPDVDEAVRREVDARPVIKSSGEKEVDPELKARAQRLAALCAENTARSRERKAAAQRFEDGVTAATEQVAKQRAAQDIAAARQRAAQNAAAAAAIKPDEQAAKTEEHPEQPEQQPLKTEEQPAKHEEQPVKTEEQPAPEPVATLPIVSPVPVVVQESPEPAPQQALPIICEPQTPAATPQQGELLPVPAAKQLGKRAAVQGELLPIETRGRACRLPEDWQLPRKWGEWAMQEYGFTEDEVRFHAKQFYRHWVSSSKSNAYKKSWYLTWQKWMGVEYEKKQRYNNRPQQKSKMMQVIESFSKKYDGDFHIPF